MQHVGGHYNTGNTTAFHSMHFTPAAENTTTNVSSGPTTTSVLRSWRKKDASEKQSSTTPSSAEPSSVNVSENQGPVARVAPHNHYPKPPPADIYRYPQQHGEYGVQNVSQIPAPVKYSEIIEPMQSIEQIPPILQKPKEKSYLEMCNVQQNHMKPPYQDYQNYKQHYDGLKNYNHVPTYKQQYHPYLQKESQMPGYGQKEANGPPQYLHNYKMSPSNYPRNYPREGNEFLANLNKIAPDMAQDIINDPHLRDPHLREPQFPLYPPAASMDQNRLYQQQHPRMYQRTSPIQHGVQNYGQRSMPQNFNQYPMNQQRMQPSDPYRMYPAHQRYGQAEPQMPANISPRQYHENMMGFPPRISPNYPSCGQLEYAQHYQHRQVPMRQEYLPIPNKPYIETHPEIPEIVPDESIHQPKKTLKAYLENWREEFTEEVESTEAIAADKIQVVKSTVPNRENTLYVLDAMDIPSENIPQYLHLQPIDKLPPNIRAFTYNAEENVRQNTIVISANVKADETNKNEISAKHSGNTYQLFENKTDRSTDSLVYQSNIRNPYKNEEISSHEDRPACKLLQSMVKARNANANERPLEKLEKNISDKDKILRSCFQEPLKEVCRSLPQLMHEEAEKLNKTNEEHLENDYSKIVDSILEENTQNVHVMPVAHSVRDISDNTEKIKETVKEESHLTTMTTNINDNTSLHFAENLMKSLEVVERKSVIAENTLPHVVPENQSDNVELQSSYLFSMPEEHLEDLATTSGVVNIKSEDEERATTKITYDLEDKEQPKDLLALEDPIDLSHHLEDMDHSVKKTTLETAEKTGENMPRSAEEKHAQNDLFEYQNLEKRSNVSVTDDEECSHSAEESTFETGHKINEETKEDMRKSVEQKHAKTDIFEYKILAKESNDNVTDDEEINLSPEESRQKTGNKTNEKDREEMQDLTEEVHAETDIFEYKNIAKQSNNSISDDEEIHGVEKSSLETDDKTNEKTGENVLNCAELNDAHTDTFDYTNLEEQSKDSINDETKTNEVILAPERESTSCNNREKEECITPKTALETSELQNLDDSGNEEQVLNNLVCENEKIQTENSGNLEQEGRHSQDKTVKEDVQEDVDEDAVLPRVQDRSDDNEFEEKCEESSNHDPIKLTPQVICVSDGEVQVSNSEDVQVPKEDILQTENEITTEDDIKRTENKAEIMEEMIHQTVENCEDNIEENTEIEDNGEIMEEITDQNAENCESNKEETPKSECNVDDIVQDQCSSSNKELQMKTVYEVCDNNENVDQMQEELCNVEERTCNIKEQHNDTITYVDNTTSDTIESSQDVDETIENNLNQETIITTDSEEEERSESVNNIIEETDEEDVVDYTDEAIKSTSVSIDQEIINIDDDMAEARKTDNVKITRTNEVSSTENAHFEDDLNESKEAESIDGEIEDFRNNLSEVVPDSELPDEIFEDRKEITTSNSITHLDGKEENNNEIIKETILKNNHDNEVIDNQKIEENNESLKERVLSVSSVSDIVVVSNKLNEITSVQLSETNQGSIDEGNVAKEEIGSSFVLEIAKELLQINVSEDSNGEKIISITPLTKVKVITPMEETKENALTKVKVITPMEETKEKADKHEEVPDKMIYSDVKNNKDQLNYQEEVENEISTVEEIEISQDAVVYQAEFEEASETILTTEEIDEPEQGSITVDEIEEKQDVIEEEETEETCNNLNHVDDTEHPVEDEEIIEESEILVETYNEVEAVGLNIEDYENDQEILQADIIPVNDLDLHNEIIIDHKEETHDEILLENAQTEVMIAHTEEIIQNIEECTKMQEEERTINSKYVEQILCIESHKIKNKKQRDKNKKRKVHQLQNPSKKVMKRMNEKKIDNKNSQLTALRNFRKIKNRNAISELNQQRLAYLNTKKKKSYFPKVNKIESSFDSAERAKIFSSVVVIDKIPLETIKKVTERSVIEEKNKLKEKYEPGIKKHAKIKLKDDKLSKEYKNIKTKFKRQREIARDIKRLKQKQKSSKPDDRKPDNTHTKKDDNATVITNVKNTNQIKDQLKTKNNYLTISGNDKQNTSNDTILDGKSTSQKIDSNWSTMSSTSSNILASDLNTTEKQSMSNPLQSSENLEAKAEEKKLVDDQKINKENSIAKLTILDNSVSGTKTRNDSTIDDETAKGAPRSLKVPPTLYPKQYTVNTKRTELVPEVDSLRASDNFQAPLSKNIQNPSKKISKDLRRSKSENHFSSDYLLNCKKRRLSLEEYNNRKRNLNKLTQKKIESETKSSMPTSTVEDNKHKQKMVEEVLKCLNSEVVEDVDAEGYCSKEISLQKDLTLNSVEPACTLTKNTNTENILNENVSKNSEPIFEKTPNENITKCSIMTTTVMVEHTAKCEPLNISLSIENIEHIHPKDITLNEINNHPNIEEVESAKDLSQKVPSIEHNTDISSNVKLPNEEEIQMNSDKIQIEASTSNCQLTDSNNTPLETPKADDNSKRESENYARAYEYFDKSSIEEKLNSLEEFLPKIAPKDLAGVEISRKLEEILEENPITYDQKHFEMLLIRRFLNHEILTQEEVKRVRQIVQYKRAFQSMKKSTPTDIPKRRYSSEFSKSIKIDFSDFDLKKSDPVPAVKKEEPAQRRICYNRSISAFVEAESRKNEMKIRRHSARTSSESKFDWLNKEMFNRQSDFSRQPIEEPSEGFVSIKPSVIVENTSINKLLEAPNSYKEKSTFLRSVAEDIISSNIIPFSSSPKSKPFTKNNLIESYRECKTLEIEPEVEFMDVDVKDNVLRKCTDIQSLEIEKKGNEIDAFSSGMCHNTSNNSEIIQIDLTEEISSKSTSTVTNKLEEIYLEVPLNVVNNKDKTEHLISQDWVTEEVVKTQEEITKPLPNSLSEYTSNPPTKTPISSNYIKHNILSIISKDNDKQRVATLESPRRNQIIDECKEEMPKRTLPSQTFRHTIQNLISHDHSSPKKYSNIPQPEEQVSKITCTLPKSSKYIIPECSPKKELNKDHLSNIVQTVEKSIVESPLKDTNHINSSTNSEENSTKSLNLEIHKILSPKQTKHISPSRTSTSYQSDNKVIINPTTASKIGKQSEAVTLGNKEKSISSQIAAIKNIKEASPYKVMEERQKKISNLEGSSFPKSEKASGKNALVDENKKRTFEQSPIRKTSDITKEKSSKIKKFEKNQQEIASLEKSVSNLTIDKDCKMYPKFIQTNVNLETPTLTSIFTKKEHEKIAANTSPVKMKTFTGNDGSNKNDMKTHFEKSLHPEKKLEGSPKKAPVEINIKHSEIKQIITNKECTPGSSGSKPLCSISKTIVMEASCQNSPNKMISKTKAQLKSFQDTIAIKSRNEDDKIPNNANISPVISNITKLTALLTYYKKGLESGGDISNLKKIKEIIDKVSPNLKNLPSVPDVSNVPNEYAVSKPEAEHSKIKLHLKKVHGENKKKKKRFRNLYTENDSEEDGCADPKAKEPKMDENAIDYSVYQRKSPAGVPKLVIKRRKSDFKSGLQPYVKINRISSIESMVKKRKRTILVNQVFVDT